MNYLCIRNKNNMERTKLVVFNEHTLGFITPEQPEIVQQLHNSILKGSRYSDRSTIYVNTGTVRLASEFDFEDYRCSFGGFNNPNEYVFKQR